MDLTRIAEDLMGIIVFELSGLQYCANIRYLQTILNPMESLPGFPDMALSIPGIQMYDNTFAFIDLYKILALERCGITPSSRILLLETGEKKIAFCVEKIIEIITLSEKDKIMKVKFDRPESEGLIAGYLRYNDHKYILPDYSKIALMAGV